LRLLTILHKSDLGAKVREAQKVLGLATRFYENVQIHADVLASHYPTREQFSDYFRQLYSDPLKEDKTRAANTWTKLFRLFEKGRGQNIEAVRYSTWAALKAVTEYVDHHRPTRARTVAERASRRLQSQWFGTGAALKARAWNRALAMAT